MKKKILAIQADPLSSINIKTDITAPGDEKTESPK